MPILGIVCGQNCSNFSKLFSELWLWGDQAPRPLRVVDVVRT